LLYYKSEAKENSGRRPPYELKIEVKPENTSDKDFELILNKA